MLLSTSLQQHAAPRAVLSCTKIMAKINKKHVCLCQLMVNPIQVRTITWSGQDTIGWDCFNPFYFFNIISVTVFLIGSQISIRLTLCPKHSKLVEHCTNQASISNFTGIFLNVTFKHVCYVVICNKNIWFSILSSPTVYWVVQIFNFALAFKQRLFVSVCWLNAELIFPARTCNDSRLTLCLDFLLPQTYNSD